MLRFSFFVFRFHAPLGGHCKITTCSDCRGGELCRPLRPRKGTNGELCVSRRAYAAFTHDEENSPIGAHAMRPLPNRNGLGKRWPPPNGWRHDQDVRHRRDRDHFLTQGNESHRATARRTDRPFAAAGRPPTDRLREAPERLHTESLHPRLWVARHLGHLYPWRGSQKQRPDGRPLRR